MHHDNTGEAHQQIPDYPLLLCRFLDPGSFTFPVLQLQPHPMLRKRTIERTIERALDKQARSDVVIVVVDAGSLSSFGKLLALLARNRTVHLIGSALETRGFRVNGSFAMYPTAKRISVAYERGSIAARYAESMLLPNPHSAPARWINSALSKTTLGASSIELIAVVGRKK